ncbi:MAG: hypothetical protein RIQ79_762 [Verrucomicrobiota bacterium]
MNQDLLLVVISSSLIAASAHAGSRSSANYSVPTETFASSSLVSTSAAYTANGGTGTIGVLSVAPGYTVKSGYIAQLYEVTGLQIAATPGTINETGTRQLSAGLLLDDATTLAVAASSVTWSVQNGPLTGIDANGLATAAPVFQNTLATAQGLYSGATGTLGLTVLDTVPDNFGTYAGDGLGDDWQVQYFGQNNPAAAPAMDPDGDGQNNLFEFTAGLVPTDRASVFVVNLAIPVGQPAQRSIVFSPRLAGRTYTVKTSTTLSGWTDLTAPAVSDNGTERTVTDLTASGPRQFYRVEVNRP